MCQTVPKSYQIALIYCLFFYMVVVWIAKGDIVMFIELTNEKLMECDGGNTFYDLGENIIRRILKWMV